MYPQDSCTCDVTLLRLSKVADGYEIHIFAVEHTIVLALFSEKDALALFEQLQRVATVRFEP